MSIIGAAFPIAILVGPVLGGAITDYWGWPWVFWINIPFGLAALGLAMFAIPHIEPGARRRFDLAGTVAFTVAFVALVLAVTWIGDRAPRHPPPWWPSSSRRSASPPSSPSSCACPSRSSRSGIFADRTIAAGVALSAIIGIGLFSVTAYLPTYFQMAYRTTATVSGLVPIATVFGMLVSNLATGWLVSRTGHYRVYPIVGTALGAAGLLGDGAAARSARRSGSRWS